MKIEIRSTTTSLYYGDGQDVLHDYPCLSDFGYEAVTEERPKRSRIVGEDGKVTWKDIGETYSVTTHYVNIDTIEKLFELSRLTNMELIIRAGEGYDDYVEIYDGYRE